MWQYNQLASRQRADYLSIVVLLSSIIYLLLLLLLLQLLLLLLLSLSRIYRLGIGEHDAEFEAGGRRAVSLHTLPPGFWRVQLTG